MKTHQFLNQLLTCVAYAVKQRHLPDLAEVIKEAATLINSVHTQTSEQIEEGLQKIVKNFEAKLVSGGEVTPQDLIMDSAEPQEEVPEEDFAPLPDAVEVKDLAADQELEEQEDFLAELDGKLDDA